MTFALLPSMFFTSFTSDSFLIKPDAERSAVKKSLDTMLRRSSLDRVLPSIVLISPNPYSLCPNATTTLNPQYVFPTISDGAKEGSVMVVFPFVRWLNINFLMKSGCSFLGMVLKWKNAFSKKIFDLSMNIEVLMLRLVTECSFVFGII